MRDGSVRSTKTKPGTSATDVVDHPESPAGATPQPHHGTIQTECEGCSNDPSTEGHEEGCVFAEYDGMDRDD